MNSSINSINDLNKAEDEQLKKLHHIVEDARQLYQVVVYASQQEINFL